MENKSISGEKLNETANGVISSTTRRPAAAGVSANKIKSINLSGDQFIVTDELPGVYCDGVQYYDLKNIGYMNNTGMANLIDLLRSLLEHNVDVQFVNVNERIRSKIRSLGLDHILICS